MAMRLIVVVLGFQAVAALSSAANCSEPGGPCNASYPCCEPNSICENYGLETTTCSYERSASADAASIPPNTLDPNTLVNSNYFSTCYDIDDVFGKTEGDHLSNDEMKAVSCAKAMIWAKDTGIQTNPEYYANYTSSGLSKDSPWPDFQCALYQMKGSDEAGTGFNCTYPCTSTLPQCPSPARIDEEDAGKDMPNRPDTLNPNALINSTVDSACYDVDTLFGTSMGQNVSLDEMKALTCANAMIWAKQTGINSHPEFYANYTDNGLTKDSAWADFQCALYQMKGGDEAGIGWNCTYPCTSALPQCPPPKVVGSAMSNAAEKDLKEEPSYGSGLQEEPQSGSGFPLWAGGIIALACVGLVAAAAYVGMGSKQGAKKKKRAAKAVKTLATPAKLPELAEPTTISAPAGTIAPPVYSTPVATVAAPLLAYTPVAVAAPTYTFAAAAPAASVAAPVPTYTAVAAAAPTYTVATAAPVAPVPAPVPTYTAVVAAAPEYTETMAPTYAAAPQSFTAPMFN